MLGVLHDEGRACTLSSYKSSRPCRVELHYAALMLWCFDSELHAMIGSRRRSLALQHCDLLSECWMGCILQLGMAQQAQGLISCCSFAFPSIKHWQVPRHRGDGSLCS